MGAHLCQVILHDIPDDAKLIKVPSAALCSKGLLEADLHIGDEIPVPCGRQELVGKSACSTHVLTYRCSLDSMLHLNRPGQTSSPQMSMSAELVPSLMHRHYRSYNASHDAGLGLQNFCTGLLT